MKQPNGPRRRSHRGSEGEKPGVFTIDSLSALSDWVKHRPQSILSISARRDHEAKVRALLGDRVVEIKVWDQRQGEGEEDGEGASPVVAQVRVTAIDSVELQRRLLGRQRDVIVALDHITDPRNLGAIVRSAAFFGVGEVLVPSKRQTLLTGAAINTSQGGFARTDLVVVTNLVRALEDLKESGYWIIGADSGGEELAAVAGFYEKVVVVLGAEDKGLSELTRKRCDRIVSIPGGGLDSLNVSVAAGIFLFHFRR